MSPQYRCVNCQDQRWVCAQHPAVPWDEGQGCPCGAEGLPCGACNTGFPALDPDWKPIAGEPHPPPRH